MPTHRLVSPTKVKRKVLDDAIAQVQCILWVDYENMDDFGTVNPAKEWDNSTLENVAQVLIDAGLGVRSTHPRRRR